MTTQPFLAEILGRSDGGTEAERFRLDFGAFDIPCPEGTTVMERPFGMFLTGHRDNDRQRVHIRIAAVQAGLLIDINNKGNIICPAPLLTAYQFYIMRLAAQLDAIGRYFSQYMAPTPKEIPWGFRLEDWADPDEIQERIQRDMLVEQMVAAPTEPSEADQQDQQLPEDTDVAEVNWNDWVQDWVTEN